MKKIILAICEFYIEYLAGIFLFIGLVCCLILSLTSEFIGYGQPHWWNVCVIISLCMIIQVHFIMGPCLLICLMIGDISITSGSGSIDIATITVQTLVE
jgi:hypothetical protein